jgi:hypothetical protein
MTSEFGTIYRQQFKTAIILLVIMDYVKLKPVLKAELAGGLNGMH